MKQAMILLYPTIYFDVFLNLHSTSHFSSRGLDDVNYAYIQKLTIFYAT